MLNLEEELKGLELNDILIIKGVKVKKGIRSYIVQLENTNPITKIKEPVWITFSNIVRDRQDFEVIIKVKVPNNEPFEQKLNLNSQSAVGTLVTNLNGGVGNKKEGYNWVMLINQAGGIIKEIIDNNRKPLKFKIDTSYEENSYLLFPFLEEGTPSMIHGDGDTGKSYFCLSLIIHSILGQDFLGYKTKPFKTLYIDYEDTKMNFDNRIIRILNGIDNGFVSTDREKIVKGIEYYKPEGGMVEEEEIISRMIEESNFDLIVIDAGADAASGSPMDEQKVLAMFNSLGRINCTKLLIHHEPKKTEGVDAGKSYYGTTYWRNRSRIVWRLTTANISKDNIKTIKAENTKLNSNLPQDSFHYTMQWGSDPHRFELRRAESYNENETDTVKEKEKQILEIMTRPEMSQSMLIEITGIPKATISRLIASLEKRGEITRNIDGRYPTFSKVGIEK